MNQGVNFLGFFKRRQNLLHTASQYRTSLALLKKFTTLRLPPVASAADKVFFHIFLTCKCFMVINVRRLHTLFYTIPHYQSSSIPS